MRKLILAMIAASASVAMAGTYVQTTTSAAAPVSLYGPGWSTGAYALFLTPDADAADDVWGGGVQVDYFFNEYVGLGASAELADIDGDVGGYYALAGTVRYPVGYFAPYLMASVGAQNYFETDIAGRVGAGVEVKFTETFGLFADWQYAFPGGGGVEDDFEDYQLIRFGARFSF